MSRFSQVFMNEEELRVTHRFIKDVPDCTPAHDIFVRDKDGYLTIKNPAPKYQGNNYIIQELVSGYVGLNNVTRIEYNFVDLGSHQ